VQAVCRVHIPKGACKCGGVRSMRDELHGALKNTRHSCLCGCLWDTKLYKSSHWGQERIGFASLRPHASVARLGIQGRATQSSERSEMQGEKLLDFSSLVRGV
jgi:hypothetical protein